MPGVIYRHSLVSILMPAENEDSLSQEKAAAPGTLMPTDESGHYGEPMPISRRACRYFAPRDVCHYG